MNPWKKSLLDFCRNIVRFGLWFALALNAVMLAIFSIVFTYQLLTHFWSYCRRTIFNGEW